MSDKAFEDAKSYLLTASTKTGTNLYDHLASVITKLLDERPANSADLLESVSQKIKSEDLSSFSTIQDKAAQTKGYATAETRAKLFSKGDGEDDDLLEDNEATPPIHDVLNSCQMLEDGGVGLGKEETFRVYLALRQLMNEQPVTDVSFWGKVMGTNKDYLIAECVYKDGEEPEPPEPEEEPEPEPEPELEDGEVPLPKSAFIKPKPLPVEPYGEGANKKAYFVCNLPGEPWVALPLANPAAIVVSRQIRKYFSGDLSAAVVSYPPFPGTEADLLRARIASISAECHLSPLGLYTLDEEDADEDEAPMNFIPDEEYEGVSKSALLDASMSGWAHHIPHILPQGRCKWMNPAPPKPEEEDEDDEEEEEEVEPETGPPLLTPAQEDEPVDDGPAWNVRLTSPMNVGYSGVMASSNLWPGAHVVSWNMGKSYENVYIGYGQRYDPEPYSPPLPPPAQAEYAGEIVETIDPTREEEEQYEAEQAANDEEDDEED